MTEERDAIQSVELQMAITRYGLQDFLAANKGIEKHLVSISQREDMPGIGLGVQDDIVLAVLVDKNRQGDWYIWGYVNHSGTTFTNQFNMLEIAQFYQRIQAEISEQFEQGEQQ
jgi:hypothetical protein